ncbi:MAG: hypothetical protein E7463_06980 [Ruminococcaceae bacterium]|nr:hypothetical protein [Oscillospiraceae bacterium]
MAAECRYDDRKLINPETIPLYARTNEAFLEGDVKGIIVELPGLGGSSCLGGLIEMGDYANDHALAFAKKGILLLYIFPGPWSWGNRAAIRITDAVVAAAAEKYHLPDGFPLAVSGGSMGGVGALMYTADTRYPLKACFAACPCVDVPACFNTRSDFPRTYISAVAGYDMELEEALKRISPIHRIDDMPDIFYYISSDGADELFAESLCDRYVDELRMRGHDVMYRRQPGKLHGQFLPEVWQEMHVLMEKCILE